METPDYNEEELDDLVTMKDENGDEVQFEFLDMIVYENQNYAVLMPLDDEENRVVILKEESDSEDTASYCSVDDEETEMKVYEMFKEKHKDDFDFAE